MKSIWTLGEPLCEIMRTECDQGLEQAELFRGPYPSGAPAIFIDTAARLGHQSGIIGAIGNDSFGSCIKNRLLKDGVDCSCLQTNHELSTAVAFVAYTSDGDRTFIYHIGNAAAGAVTLPPALPSDVGIFHVMGCAMMASASMAEGIAKLVPYYHQAGAVISFDPNIRTESLKEQNLQELTKPVMEHCSILMPGLEELLCLAGEKTVEAAAQKLFERNVLQMIVLKNGSNGCHIITREENFHVPVCKVTALDSTGAGDSFDAGFLTSYLNGNSLLFCAQTASATAALNCAAFGPMEGNITPQTVKQMILKNYGSFNEKEKEK